MKFWLLNGTHSASTTIRKIKTPAVGAGVGDGEKDINTLIYQNCSWKLSLLLKKNSPCYFSKLLWLLWEQMKFWVHAHTWQFSDTNKDDLTSYKSLTEHLHMLSTLMKLTADVTDKPKYLKLNASGHPSKTNDWTKLSGLDWDLKVEDTLLVGYAGVPVKRTASLMSVLLEEP